MYNTYDTYDTEMKVEVKPWKEVDGCKLNSCCSFGKHFVVCMSVCSVYGVRELVW